MAHGSARRSPTAGAGQAAQKQSASQPQQAPGDDKPKYTPEQQQRLDEADELNKQVHELVKRGKYADAEKLAKQALEIWQQVLGTEHPYTAIGLNDLGLCANTKGNIWRRLNCTSAL